MVSRKSWGLFLGLFTFLSILVSDYVSALTIKQLLFDPVGDMFSSWAGGQLSINIAKYAFWLLLSLIIYVVLDFIPLFKADKQTFIKYLIAFIVGFLATAYLTPDDIYTILISYGALGVVLGAAIPCMILLFFSIRIREKGGPGGAIFSRVLWIAFIIFLIWKAISGMYITEVINEGEGWTYIGFVLFSIGWIIFGEKMVLKALFKEEFKTIASENYRDIAASLTAEISRRESRSQELSGAAKIAYDAQTEKLKERLNEIKKKLG